MRRKGETPKDKARQRRTGPKPRGNKGEAPHETLRSARRFSLVGLVLSVLFFAGGIAVGAGVYEFSHSVPGGSLPAAPTAVLTSSCPSSSLSQQSSAANLSAAWAIDRCTNAPVFTTNQAGGSATPTFTLPGALVGLWLVPANSTGVPTGSTPGGCAGYSSSVALTSGTSVVFAVKGDSFDYCLQGAPGASWAGFSVSWSQ